MTKHSHSYSSIAAFLAHLHALRAVPSRTPDDDRLLNAMTDTLAVLSVPERNAIVNEASDSASRRRRERAMLKLHRELPARGMLAG
jgi:hypothetical protein